MTRNISFSLTKEQFRNRTKTVSRRLGWWNLKPGEILRGVEKAQGLKKGEHIVPMGLIRVIDTRREPLMRLVREPAYGAVEVVKEGFPDMTPAQFVTFFSTAHGGLWPEVQVNRIEFEYVAGGDGHA